MDEFVLYEQFKELSLHFPGLSLQKEKEPLWLVKGLLHFSAEYNRQALEDEYSIKVGIEEGYPDIPPKTWEVGSRIPFGYHHFRDGSLCLGAPLALKRKFANNPTLTHYVRNCLIPYLYAFSYKTKYGVMPFGELPHEGVGILEHYKELFGLDDNKRVLALIQVLAEGNYRANSRCPCGSGKRLKSCHGRILLEVRDLQSQSDFQDEYEWIIRNLVDIAIKRPRHSKIIQEIIDRNST